MHLLLFILTVFAHHYVLTISSERLAKYNQLLRIEEELNGDSIYAGEHFRKAHLL